MIQTINRFHWLHPITALSQEIKIYGYIRIWKKGHNSETLWSGLTKKYGKHKKLNIYTLQGSHVSFKWHKNCGRSFETQHFTNTPCNQPNWPSFDSSIRYEYKKCIWCIRNVTRQILKLTVGKWIKKYHTQCIITSLNYQYIS